VMIIWVQLRGRSGGRR